MNARFNDRLPPQDREAEQSLLSAMLVDPGCIDDVAAIVRAEDFYFDAHQKIFSAVLELLTGGKPIDLVTTREVIRRRGQLDDVGGDTFLADLFDAVPTAANAVYHAGIVRETAIQRRVIHFAHEAIRDASAGRLPAEELLAGLEAKVFDLSSTASTGDAVHVRPIVADEMNRLDGLGEDGKAIPGITTGFRQLDEMTGGWTEGLYMVGARPSIGKSAFMLTAALAAALNGVAVLMFSLEMSRRQLVQRNLAMLAGTNLKRIRGNQRLTDGEVQGLIPAAESLSNAPLFINDTPGLHPSQILSTTRRMVRKHAVRIAFIDYAQLIEPDEGRNGTSRVEQLETISRRLKQLSRAVQIPVVALAQLNRGAEDNEKPSLQHFKGSGALEQDADDCYLLWRIEAPEFADVWTIGLDIAKQRNGPTGEIRLSYRRSCTRFEDYSAEGT